MTIREEVLTEADHLISGDRQSEYGDPTENLIRIAVYWNNYLIGIGLTDGILGPEDVAHMMILLKIARHAAGYKRDSEVDIAGYAAIAAEAAEGGEESDVEYAEA